MLMSPLPLTRFQPDEPLFLASYASSVKIGVVLFHCFANGTEKVIANASKSLTPAERNYSQIKRDALSIVFLSKKISSVFMGKGLHIAYGLSTPNDDFWL